MAFLAFATIVATLRQAFGGRLSRWQNLLFRFYVETGFMFVVQGIVPIWLLNTGIDEPTVWRISNALLLTATALYMPFHIRRRIKISAPIPLVSALVMAGWGLGIVLMIITATEYFWSPSMISCGAMMIWGLVGNIAIFVKFLGSFIELDDTYLYRTG